MWFNVTFDPCHRLHPHPSCPTLEYSLQLWAEVAADSGRRPAGALPVCVGAGVAVVAARPGALVPAAGGVAAGGVGAAAGAASPGRRRRTGRLAATGGARRARHRGGRRHPAALLRTAAGVLLRWDARDLHWAAAHAAPRRPTATAGHGGGIRHWAVSHHDGRRFLSIRLDVGAAVHAKRASAADELAPVTPSLRRNGAEVVINVSWSLSVNLY